uniref:Uncharacterized protein n=1 Tax=Vespula pensylvanica TaxID=30213 RepID=A0A834U7E7_VESPE|nr:hypothetical protein H0235_010107 [Vespula pensylvanica]
MDEQTEMKEEDFWEVSSGADGDVPLRYADRLNNYILKFLDSRDFGTINPNHEAYSHTLERKKTMIGLKATGSLDTKRLLQPRSLCLLKRVVKLSGHDRSPDIIYRYGTITSREPRPPLGHYVGAVLFASNNGTLNNQDVLRSDLQLDGFQFGTELSISLISEDSVMHLASKVTSTRGHDENAFSHSENVRKETFTIDLSNPLGVDERLWGHTVTLYGASLVTSSKTTVTTVDAI